MRSAPRYSASDASAAFASPAATRAKAPNHAPIVFMPVSPLISNVLQEPLRWQLPPQPFAARRLVHDGRHREELRALDVAPLRVRHLVTRSARLLASIDHLRVAHVAARARDGGRALPAAHFLPPRVVGPRDVA